MLSCLPCYDKLLVRHLIEQWHSTHGSRPIWKQAFVLKHGVSIIGVSVWGMPTARLEDRSGATWEHYRMALSPQTPHDGASWFMARNRDWIRDNEPQVVRLIAYVDEEIHRGITYISDNWSVVYRGRRNGNRIRAARPDRSPKELGSATKFERIIHRPKPGRARPGPLNVAW